MLAFLVVPVAVYMVTWLPWFHHFGWSLSAWWENHGAMWRYHANLTEVAYDSTHTDTFTPTHGYYSKAWTWILMMRPVNFYVENTRATSGRSSRSATPPVLGQRVGDPVRGVVVGQDPRLACGVRRVPFLVMCLPWFLVSRPQFFFYVLPMTPFMALAAVYIVQALSDARIWCATTRPERSRSIRRPALPAISARHPFRPVVRGLRSRSSWSLFVWFWPLLVGDRLDHDRSARSTSGCAAGTDQRSATTG